MPPFEVILLEARTGGWLECRPTWGFLPSLPPSNPDSPYMQRNSLLPSWVIWGSAVESEWLTSKGFETSLLLHSSTHSYSGVRSRSRYMEPLAASYLIRY